MKQLVAWRYLRAVVGTVAPRGSSPSHPTSCEPVKRSLTRLLHCSPQLSQAAGSVVVSKSTQPDWTFVSYLSGAAVAGAITAGCINYFREQTEAGTDGDSTDDSHELVNWSNTHQCKPKVFHEPETTEQIEAVVAKAHAAGKQLRCVGSALSPNGLAFSEHGVISLALMDKILKIDKENMQVTVQAGARIQDVVDQLRPHGLTLQNFASIREQSVGGFTQVSAHGTGAGIPPVDEQVVGLTVVTPGRGTLHLSLEEEPDLFRMVRVGLGALGVVTDLTLQCVPAHKLVEQTYVTTAQEVRRRHARWLRENQHIRYMWIPYTDTVVVVVNNQLPEGMDPPVARGCQESGKVAALQQLLASHVPGESAEEQLSATQLRDRLIAHDPGNASWIALINQAEAEYWKRNQGYRTGWSDELLGFDCGGQQWVLEACFPAGSQRQPNGADLTVMQELLQLIEDEQIAAPSPIEQRWSAASSSPMSPAYSPVPEDLFSWVGIIMYLPSEDAAVREAISQSFDKYVDRAEATVLSEHQAVDHWAKIEVGRMPPNKLQQKLAARYPVADFNAARAALDPKNILSNPLLDVMFPRTDV